VWLVLHTESAGALVKLALGPGHGQLSLCHPGPGSNFDALYSRNEGLRAAFTWEPSTPAQAYRARLIGVVLQ